MKNCFRWFLPTCMKMLANLKRILVNFSIVWPKFSKLFEQIAKFSLKLEIFAKNCNFHWFEAKIFETFSSSPGAPMLRPLYKPIPGDLDFPKKFLGHDKLFYFIWKIPDMLQDVHSGICYRHRLGTTKMTCFNPHCDLCTQAGKTLWTYVDTLRKKEKTLLKFFDSKPTDLIYFHWTNL